MTAFTITCPGCNKKYNLTTERPQAVAMQKFTCPRCGFTIPFTTLEPSLAKYIPSQPQANAQQPGAPKSVIFNPGANGMAGGASPRTRAYQDPMAPTNVPMLKVEGSNRVFRFKPGEYVLGRDSRDSRATVKIAPDPYMSRQHARLTVAPVGQKLVAQLIPMASANKILVNDSQIAVGAPVALRPGDKVTLGMTVLIYSE